MATAPLTDKRQSDFLKGAQFAVCPINCRSNGLVAKRRKMNGLRMKHQNSASSVSRSFISSDFPSVACSVVGCLSSVWSARQGFRAEYAPQEEDSARNGSDARPCRCRQSHTLPLHPSIGNRWLVGYTSTVPSVMTSATREK